MEASRIEEAVVNPWLWRCENSWTLFCSLLLLFLYIACYFNWTWKWKAQSSKRDESQNILHDLAYAWPTTAVQVRYKNTEAYNYFNISEIKYFKISEVIVPHRKWGGMCVRLVFSFIFFSFYPVMKPFSMCFSIWAENI